MTVGYHLAASLMLAPLSAGAAIAQNPAVEKTLQTALERLQSGVPLTEFSDNGETEISARPLRTWKSVSGHFCRAYEVRVSHKGQLPVIETGTRCRGTDGMWREVEDK